MAASGNLAPRAVSEMFMGASASVLGTAFIVVGMAMVSVAWIGFGMVFKTWADTSYAFGGSRRVLAEFIRCAVWTSFLLAGLAQTSRWLLS